MHVLCVLCACACLHVSAFIFIHVKESVRTQILIFVCVYESMYKRTYEFTYARVFGFINKHVNVCACAQV